MKLKLLFLLIFVTEILANTTKVNIPLYVPSGATSNFSKTFYNKIKLFEKNNPQINVILKEANTYFGAFKEVLSNNKHKKSSGVIILEVSELAQLVEDNAIIPLDDFIKNNKNLYENILPNFLKNSYYNNKIYGLPYYRSTPIVYYNLDLLKEYRLGKNDLPTTWDELFVFLNKIRTITKTEPLLLPPVWFDWLFESFVVQNGGSLATKDNLNVKFNSPEVIATLEFWKKLKDNGLMKKRPGNWKSTVHLFINEKYPIIYYSSGGMALLDKKARFNWYAGVMPKNKVYGNVVGASSIFLSNHMTNNEKMASYKLLKFLFSDDVQVELSLKTGYFSVTKSSFNDINIRNRDKIESYANAKKQLKYSNSKIMVKNYYKVRLLLKKAINMVLDGKIPAKKALDDAQNEAQKWLN